MSINLIVELVGGYIIPGLPLANMVRPAPLQLSSPRAAADFAARTQLFKLYGVQTLAIGLYFLQDLKLGHYMKIPPRATFTGASLASYSPRRPAR